jgi:hypothetical protein
VPLLSSIARGEDGTIISYPEPAQFSYCVCVVEAGILYLHSRGLETP